VSGVSEKVLTAQLRELEESGVISRTASGTLPPRVEYALTAQGMELMPIMYAMCDWAQKYLGVKPTLGKASEGTDAVAVKPSMAG